MEMTLYHVEDWRIDKENYEAALEALRAVDTSDLEWGMTHDEAVERFADDHDEVTVHLLRFGWADRWSAYGPRDVPRGFEVGGLYGDLLDVEETIRMLSALVPFIRHPSHAKVVIGEPSGYPQYPEMMLVVKDGAIVREDNVMVEIDYF